MRSPLSKMKNGFEIHPASAFPSDKLREAMVDAFSDYAIPMRPSQSDFDGMMLQRGLDRSSSRVALVGDEIAAIWLTSVRAGRAYLISSGTRPAYRGKGMARAMGVDCLGHLRGIGARSFQTEVLRNNEMALPLYLSLGMTKRRRLDCYRLPAASPIVAEQGAIRQVNWADIAGQIADLRDWAPSWQNSDEAVAAIADRVTCLACSDGATLEGAVIVNARNGTVHQLMVRQDARRRGLGAALLAAAKTAAMGGDLRLINVDGNDEGFRALMARVGAEETIGQFELFMSL